MELAFRCKSLALNEPLYTSLNLPGQKVIWMTGHSLTTSGPNHCCAPGSLPGPWSLLSSLVTAEPLVTAGILVTAELPGHCRAPGHF